MPVKKKPKTEEKSKLKVGYRTNLGACFQGDIEHVIKHPDFQKYRGKFNLIFTSPPFPLNHKKKYGNLNGKKYVEWLTKLTTSLKDYLSDDGSLVIEIGNSWEENEAAMSTLPLETLLAIKKKGKYQLCQQFIWYNTAKLPSPAHWVTIKRTRVKDSFTTIWWLSKTTRPKANNKKVLVEYSESMKKLLKSKKYNSGLRPSEHKIGKKSFLKNNGGAIPANVLVSSNTASKSRYLTECKKRGIDPHPARMPHSIAKFFIKFLTDSNDLILDPFSGSNTTGEVSQRLRRRWVTVEIDENYVNTSKLKFRKCL